MRTFEAKTNGLSTSDIVAYQSDMRTKQNNLANSGGGTVPQFRIAGPSLGGQDANQSIQSMASKQVQLDENSSRNHCLGLPRDVGTCGGSRKKQMKYQKKDNKKKITVVRRRLYQKKRHDTRNYHNRKYTVKNR